VDVNSGFVKAKRKIATGFSNHLKSEKIWWIVALVCFLLVGFVAGSFFMSSVWVPVIAAYILGIILGMLLARVLLYFIEKKLATPPALQPVWEDRYFLYGLPVIVTLIGFRLLARQIAYWQANQYHPPVALLLLFVLLIGGVIYLFIATVIMIHKSFKELGQVNGWLWGLFAVIVPYGIGMVITFLVAMTRLQKQHLWR
jgi:hypothetical protein